MRDDLTYIAVVLDASGSMARLREDTLGGLNSFLEKHRQADGDVLFTLCQFNGQVSFPYDGASLKNEFSPIGPSYMPSGNTALLDAIGLTIDTVGLRLSRMQEHERPARVLIMIQTDGMENHSCLYTRGRVTEMIKHQREKYNWDFVFVGASEQAVAYAVDMGVQREWTAQYSASSAGTNQVFDSFTTGSLRYRGEQKTKGGAIKANFFDPGSST